MWCGDAEVRHILITLANRRWLSEGHSTRRCSQQTSNKRITHGNIAFCHLEDPGLYVAGHQ